MTNRHDNSGSWHPCSGLRRLSTVSLRLQWSLSCQAWSGSSSSSSSSCSFSGTSVEGVSARNCRTGFRDLTAHVAREASIAVFNLSAEAFAAQPRLPLPDGAMLDGVVLSRAESERFLIGVPRIVICTGLEYAELRARWTHHPHVRLLLKPFQLGDLEAALRWLAGDDEELGWQSQPGISPSSGP